MGGEQAITRPEKGFPSHRLSAGSDPVFFSRSAVPGAARLVFTFPGPRQDSRCQ